MHKGQCPKQGKRQASSINVFIFVLKSEEKKAR